MAAVCVVSFLGCQPDLAQQPKIPKPDWPSAFFNDGRASRPVEHGTVARGQLDAEPARFTGRTDGGGYVDDYPVPVTEAVVARGRERFNIFCQQCHGRRGNGDGKVVLRGYVRPPNFHTDLSRGYKLRGQEVKLADVPVGYIFSVITHGYGAMPSHAELVFPDDRWAVIAYVRALQLTTGEGGAGDR